jgi:hypothetical protein
MLVLIIHKTQTRKKKLENGDSKPFTQLKETLKVA